MTYTPKNTTTVPVIILIAIFYVHIWKNTQEKLNVLQKKSEGTGVDTVNDKLSILLMAFRRAALLVVDAIEEYLDMERTKDLRKYKGKNKM